MAESTKQQSSGAIAGTFTAAVVLGMLVQLFAAGAVTQQLALNPGVKHWGVTTWQLALPSVATAAAIVGTLFTRGPRAWLWACLLSTCAIGGAIVFVDRAGLLIEYERWIREGMP